VTDIVRGPRMSTVVGFGLTQEGGQASARLRQVDIPVVAQQDCRQVYGSQSITDANFCAGEKQGGRDSCQGDSGGPLLVPDSDGPLQAGVVSWGKGCARPGYYGVYASVGHFEDWIKARVRDVTCVGNGTSSASSSAAAALTSGASEAVKPSQLAQVTV